MLPEIGTKLPSESLSDLIQGRTLEEFDGPLLVEFRTPCNKIYLCAWIDKDEHLNRWVYFRVTQKRFEQYLKESPPWHNLLDKNANTIVYLVDRNTHGDVVRIATLSAEALWGSEIQPAPNP